MLSCKKTGQTRSLKRILSFFTAIVFISTSLVTPSTYAQSIFTPAALPIPGTLLGVTQAFKPLCITGVNIDPTNPLRFNFIIDEGDTSLSSEEFDRESMRLVRYFLAALTTPKDEMWVNLSPYEKDRIIPDDFGKTEMGRDLLAQDYLLKQLSASLSNPEEELGSDFWARIKQKAEAEGLGDIQMSTFNKIWIVPQMASVYEHAKGAYVVDSHLKVMMEEDYVALANSEQRIANSSIQLSADNSLNAKRYTPNAEIIRTTLLPIIEKEVNQGSTFANLRQIYNSVILATWYKQNLKESVLGQVFVDQHKTKGIEIEDKSENQAIYDRYVKAFKTGVYNYIKEEYDPALQTSIPRKYFSGGASMDLASLDSAAISRTEVPEDAATITVDLAAMTSEESQITKIMKLSPDLSPNVAEDIKMTYIYMKNLIENGGTQFKITPDVPDNNRLKNGIQFFLTREGTLDVKSANFAKYTPNVEKLNEFARLTDLPEIDLAALNTTKAVEVFHDLNKRIKDYFHVTMDRQAKSIVDAIDYVQAIQVQKKGSFNEDDIDGVKDYIKRGDIREGLKLLYGKGAVWNSESEGIWRIEIEGLNTVLKNIKLNPVNKWLHQKERKNIAKIKAALQFKKQMTDVQAQRIVDALAYMRNKRSFSKKHLIQNLFFLLSEREISDTINILEGELGVIDVDGDKVIVAVGIRSRIMQQIGMDAASLGQNKSFAQIYGLGPTDQPKLWRYSNDPLAGIDSHPSNMPLFAKNVADKIVAIIDSYSYIFDLTVEWLDDDNLTVTVAPEKEEGAINVSFDIPVFIEKLRGAVADSDGRVVDIKSEVEEGVFQSTTLSASFDGATLSRRPQIRKDININRGLLPGVPAVKKEKSEDDLLIEEALELISNFPVIKRDVEIEKGVITKRIYTLTNNIRGDVNLANLEKNIESDLNKALEGSTLKATVTVGRDTIRVVFDSVDSAAIDDPASLTPVRRAVRTASEEEGYALLKVFGVGGGKKRDYRKDGSDKVTFKVDAENNLPYTDRRKIAKRITQLLELDPEFDKFVDRVNVTQHNNIIVTTKTDNMAFPGISPDKFVRERVAPALEQLSNMENFKFERLERNKKWRVYTEHPNMEDAFDKLTVLIKDELGEDGFTYEIPLSDELEVIITSDSAAMISKRAYHFGRGPYKSKLPLFIQNSVHKAVNKRLEEIYRKDPHILRLAYQYKDNGIFEVSVEFAEDQYPTEEEFNNVFLDYMKTTVALYGDLKANPLENWEVKWNGSYGPSGTFKLLYLGQTWEYTNDESLNKKRIRQILNDPFRGIAAKLSHLMENLPFYSDSIDTMKLVFSEDGLSLTVLTKVNSVLKHLDGMNFARFLERRVLYVFDVENIKRSMAQRGTEDKRFYEITYNVEIDLFDFAAMGKSVKKNLAVSPLGKKNIRQRIAAKRNKQAGERPQLGTDGAKRKKKDPAAMTDATIDPLTGDLLEFVSETYDLFNFELLYDKLNPEISGNTLEIFWVLKDSIDETGKDYRGIPFSIIHKERKEIVQEMLKGRVQKDKLDVNVAVDVDEKILRIEFTMTEAEDSAAMADTVDDKVIQNIIRELGVTEDKARTMMVQAIMYGDEKRRNGQSGFTRRDLYKDLDTDDVTEVINGLMILTDKEFLSYTILTERWEIERLFPALVRKTVGDSAAMVDPLGGIDMNPDVVKKDYAMLSRAFISEMQNMLSWAFDHQMSIPDAVEYAFGSFIRNHELYRGTSSLDTPSLFEYEDNTAYFSFYAKSGTLPDKRIPVFTKEAEGVNYEWHLNLDAVRQILPIIEVIFDIERPGLPDAEANIYSVDRLLHPDDKHRQSFLKRVIDTDSSEQEMLRAIALLEEKSDSAAMADATEATADLNTIQSLSETPRAVGLKLSKLIDEGGGKHLFAQFKIKVFEQGVRFRLYPASRITSDNTRGIDLFVDYFEPELRGIVNWDDLEKDYSFNESEELEYVEVFISDAVALRGGIDMNPDIMEMGIEREGRGFEIQADPALLESLRNVEGFIPVLINVTPIVNLPLLLGLADPAALPESNGPYADDTRIDPLARDEYYLAEDDAPIWN